MSGWLLQSIEIEGLRGINNEGAPLMLRLKSDCVTSISAQNGVGKSSIFDAINFAIRGVIPKLDGLPASENGRSYYVNRFHSVGAGHVTLTLIPEGGGDPVAIRVDCAADGTRTVSGPPNAEALLRDLDREFVLLDNKTFQSFIDTKDLDRGRSFAGLLGLKKYSDLRQSLQALGRTQPFNNHFGTSVLESRRRTGTASLQTAQRNAQTSFEVLTQRKLTDFQTHAEAQIAAYSSLEQIAILKRQCTGKAFGEIDFDACLEEIKKAEGGEEKDRLAKIIREQEAIEAVLNADSLTDADRDALRDIAVRREEALGRVGSVLLHEHLIVAERVLSDESWSNKNLCPTCETENEKSVFDKVTRNLSAYQAVHDLGAELASGWSDRNCDCLTDLEDAAVEEGESCPIGEIASRVDEDFLTAAQIDAIWTHRATCRGKLDTRLKALRDERSELEKKLPPSYVEVTRRVEAARRLSEAWKNAATAEAEIAAVTARKARIDKIKRFLDGAAAAFAGAESRAATRRLAAVTPICKSFFGGIVHAPVEPSLIKPSGSESLAIALAKFWSLQDVSAQALLSESFRNAFAVSVYLAAAQLYGGDAKFIILDDVTSSFDAGHQFHIMESIRTKFARPGQAGGPQVVILSHDTLLEKLFNKNGNEPDWQHIRLEGTAQTAVLQQTGAANRVRDAAVTHLNAGQVEDGALRLRPYLEYKLLEIIGKVAIPVPVDFAMDDNKKQVQNCIAAIQAAVTLHKAANRLILTPQQETGLQTHMATITGNFLSHYATGSTQAFSAPSLLGVIAAIDAYAECFMYEDPPGSGNKRYYRSLAQR